MSEFLISPAERPPVTNLGRVSSLPEKMGVDILWSCPGGAAGAQRKTFMDLIASVRDGRLGMELQQMQSLVHRFVILEGTPAWTAEGTLATSHTSWTMRQQVGVELSIQSQGTFILRTRSTLETCSTCESLFAWTQKESHTSTLLSRPGPRANGWGQVTDKAYCIHVMTGMQGIGVGLAEKLFEKYGRIPCRHDLSMDSLVSIDGIGRKKAESILKVFG